MGTELKNMAEQVFCPLDGCIYHDEDEVFLNEVGYPASNCNYPNIKMWEDTSKPCPFYRLDWKKKKA